MASSLKRSSLACLAATPLHDVAAHVQCGHPVRAPAADSRPAAPCAAQASPANSLSWPCHNAHQRRLAGSVDADDADLDPWQKVQANVLEDLLAARPGLRDAVHVVYVLIGCHALALPPRGLSGGDIAARPALRNAGARRPLRRGPTRAGPRSRAGSSSSSRAASSMLRVDAGRRQVDALRQRLDHRRDDVDARALLVVAGDQVPGCTGHGCALQHLLDGERHNRSNGGGCGSPHRTASRASAGFSAAPRKRRSCSSGVMCR